MKLQKILSRLQKLHPKEIDLSLDRINNLCKKLGNPQDNLKYISVVGTNGKYSTIQAIRAILKDANINCNIYTSPHIQKINERFIYNDEEISDENLVKLLTEVEDINNLINERVQTLTDEEIDYISEQIFGTLDINHPGVKTFKNSGKYVISGSIKVLNYSYFESEFSDTFRTAVEIRNQIKRNG